MDFFLYLQTPVFAPQSVAFLQRFDGIGAWTQRINPMGVFTHQGIGAGLIVEVQQVLQTNRFAAAIERTFQISPSLKFLFRIDEFQYAKGGQYAGMTCMLQACSFLLSVITGDAVMLSEDHQLVLQRKNNGLLLNTEWGFWNPFRISQIDLAHELRPVPPAHWS